ncbi:MAG: Lpg1974 family pore-forming outer membrane protein, partial [Planctomycetota bacterium]
MIGAAVAAAACCLMAAQPVHGQVADQEPLDIGDEAVAADVMLSHEASFSQAAGCCGDAFPSAAGTRLDVFVPNLRSGLELSAGFLLLQPGADNLGFATTTTFLPVQNPQWAVHTLTPGYQPGFTVGGRYVRPCSGKDIRATWEHLRTNDSTFVPVSNLDTQWISPFSQTGPSTSESANEVGIFHLKSAQGQVAFDYDLVNLDAGQTVNIGSETQARLFAGLSWVRLQQQLVSTFYNNPDVDPVPPVVAPANPDLRYITLNNTSSFTGAGPRLGLTTNHTLPRGFTFVGELSGAVLAGSMQPAQYSFAGVY